MSEKFDNFHIYQVQTSPNFALNYIGNGGIERANMYRGYGVDVDEAAGLMAVANFGILKIFDIGYGNGSPVNPIVLSTKDLSAQSDYNGVAINFPIVQVIRQISLGVEPLTFDISTPTNPAPLDQSFWDPSHAWNSFSTCIENIHTVFSDDGSAMYLSRYTQLQVVDPTACDGTPTCTYSLNPVQWSFPAEGGNLTVSVATQPGCTWNATTVNPWVTLNTPTNGTGSGSVSYVVAPNTVSARNGAVAVEPDPQRLPARGGFGMFCRPHPNLKLVPMAGGKRACHHQRCA